MRTKTRRRIVRTTLTSLAALLGFCVFLLATNAVRAAYGDVTTFAGRPYDGDGGTATSALLDFPDDVASDSSGNLYIADTFNNAIRKVDANGIISTYAGGAFGADDGSAATATFALPRGVAVGPDGALYVADTANNAIRKITPDGTVSTLVNEGLRGPYGVAVAGTTVFIADTGNNALKTVATAGGAVTAVTTVLDEPHKIAVTANGSTAYVADTGSARVLRVTVSTGTVDVIAGSGTPGYAEGSGAAAQFNNPLSVALSADEQTLYVSDPDLYLTDRIRAITLATAATSLLAIDTRQQDMISPAGMTVRGGNLYVAMSGLGTVRTFPLSNPGAASRAAGNDRFGGRDGTNPLFGRPHDVAMTLDGSTLYVADNNRIRKVTVATKATATVIGSIVDNYRDGTPVGTGTSNLDEARFSTIAGIVVTNDGSTLYVAEKGNHRIRTIDLASQAVTTLAGAGKSGYREGIGSQAYFSIPLAMKMGADGLLYLTESGSHRIRVIDPATGLTKLIAGSGQRGFLNGAAASARFNNLEGIAPDTAHGTLYVLDSWNDMIRQVDVQGAAPYADPAPTVASADPDNVAAGWATKTGLRVKIKGTGFRHGAITKFFTYPAVKTSVVSSTEIVVALPLASMKPGWYDITVTNVDGQFGVLENGLGLRGKGRAVPDAYFSLSESRGFLAFDAESRLGLHVAAANIIGDGKAELVLSQFDAGEGTVKVTDATGTALASFTPYGTAAAGVRTAICDLDGDGSGEIVTAPGSGKANRLFIYNGAGKKVVQTQGIAVKKAKKAGLVAACADVTGDGVPDILAAPDAASGTVTILQKNGRKTNALRPFGKSFKGGLTLAVVDTDGNGVAEIIAGTAGSSGRVRLLNGTGRVLRRISPFGTAFRGGISVAGGDVTGDGTPELIVAPRSARAPTVRLLTVQGVRIRSFLAYPRTYRGGVQVATGDANGDGILDIITVPAGAFKSSVRMFNGLGKTL